MTDVRFCGVVFPISKRIRALEEGWHGTCRFRILTSSSSWSRSNARRWVNIYCMCARACFSRLTCSAWRGIGSSHVCRDPARSLRRRVRHVRQRFPRFNHGYEQEAWFLISALALMRWDSYTTSSSRDDPRFDCNFTLVADTLSFTC